MDAAIKVQGLVKKYENFTLDKIDLEIPKGSIVGLVGANGAGKTTLMKCILGIIHKDKGEVYIDGELLEEKDASWKNKVGMVLAEAAFYENMNAQQIGKIMEYVFSDWDSDSYNRYLKEFSIEKKKKVKTYSRGMKMKLQIAVALSHKAEILMFDEATSGLDPVVRDDLLDVLLAYIQDENHTVLLSSHIISDLEKVSDYIAFLRKGKLLLMENKDEMLYQYGIGKCTREQYDKIDKNRVLKVRKGSLGYELLVEDREAFEAAYPDVIVDHAGIEEIMLLIEKGEEA